MKKILLIIVLGLTCGAFTNCTDMTTDLTLDTNTRLLYIKASPYYDKAVQYSHTWIAGEESHTLEGVEVSYFGGLLDKPLKFKFIRTNDLPQPINALSELRVGEAGVTWEDKIYEIPAGEKSVIVSIKFIKDPERVESTNAQFKYYGWETTFNVVPVDSEDNVSCRVVNGAPQVFAKELSIR